MQCIQWTVHMRDMPKQVQTVYERGVAVVKEHYWDWMKKLTSAFLKMPSWKFAIQVLRKSPKTFYLLKYTTIILFHFKTFRFLLFWRNIFFFFWYYLGKIIQHLAIFLVGLYIFASNFRENAKKDFSIVKVCKEQNEGGNMLK